MTLFQVGNTDYTNRVINPSYSVNSVPVYTDWTDGFHVTHRDVYRRRVSGSFQMRFFNNADFAAFMAALEAVKTSNYYTVTLYVSNESAARSVNVFLNPTPSLIRYAHGGINYQTFDVTVEEA